MDDRYANKKIILITGGSRGIGKAIAKRLASEDSVVLIVYKSNEAAALETVKHLKKKCFDSRSYRCNIAEYEEVKLLFDEISNTYGGVDILVNNAGVLLTKYLMIMKVEEWEHVLKTNLFGAFYCIKCALPDMIKRKKGRIINISSIANDKIVPGSVAYCSSKAGLDGLTKSLAKELMRFNIPVNEIKAGYIETDMSGSYSKFVNDKEACYGKPDDVAECVAFLAGDECKFITGRSITIDGGASL